MSKPDPTDPKFIQLTNEIGLRARRLLEHEGTHLLLEEDSSNSPGWRELQIDNYYMRNKDDLTGELFINYLGGEWAQTIYSQSSAGRGALTPHSLEQLEHLVDVLRKRMILDDLADV
jgi:hypothetical protein